MNNDTYMQGRDNISGDENLQPASPPPEPLAQHQQQYWQTVSASPGPKRGRAWIWIVVAAVFLIAAIVCAIVVFGAGKNARGLNGNAGVVAAYNFFREQQETQASLTGSVQKEIGNRLLAEPFEIGSRLKIGSDSFTERDMPFDTITVDLDTKYDMNDLGVKVRALGMEVLAAYLIEDNVVLDLMGQAACVPIELPKKEDLLKSMPLKDRVMVFLPFLPDEDSDMLMRLLETFAMSIPDEYTKTDIEDVYSPMEDKNVQMNAVTTTLNSDAIKNMAKDFAGRLKADRELSEELQNFLNEITQFFGLKDVDLMNALDQMTNSQELEELPYIQLSWSVYQRQGRYTGIRFLIDNNDMDTEFTMMSEYSEKTCYKSIIEKVSGETVQEAAYQTTYDGDSVKIKGTFTTASKDPLSSKQVSAKIELDGTYDIKKDSNNEYSVTIDLNLTNSETNSQQMSIDLILDADVRMGLDLKTLKDSPDWNGIYEKEWGSFEDILKGLNSLGSLF
ncbi:MAG: hypothetical protein ACOX8Q_01985 [Christensenellales bacterium]|jgi:hypothetical protein